MSTALIGCIQSTPASLLSSTSASSSTTATTTVTVESGTGSGTYTYQWTTSGTTVTLTNGTTVSPTFTYSAAGTTTALCNITDTIFGITVTSPNFVITWSSPIISTTFTFTPSVNTSYTYNGSTRSITVTPNPAEATYGVTSGSLTVGPGIGSTSAVVTANGSYTGSATSPTITIIRATISGGVWTLNGASFTSTQSRTAGTTYTIRITSVTPSGAFSTLNTTSRSVSAVGSYTLVSTASGNYQGSVTSPILRLVSGSITVNSPPTTVTSRNCTATLTAGTTATSYAWSRISGTVGSISSPSSQTTNINGSGSSSATFQCTITYSGGSVSPTITIQWNQV